VGKYTSRGSERPLCRAHAGVALLIAALSAPLSASPVLTFDVVSHTVAAPGAQPSKGQVLPQDASYPMTVALAGSALQIDERDTRIRYDFGKSRIYWLNKPKKTYQEVSLYTVIGFDVEEFANRMMLGRSLAAAKIHGNLMAPALTEHLMSLSDKASATVIDRANKDSDTIYSWNGQTLMTVSQKTRELSPAVLQQYLRFLRYSTGGHPQILAAIEKGGGVAERLTVVRSNMNIETRTLVLRSIDDRPDDFSLEGYTREAPQGEPYVTLKRLPASAAVDLEAHARALRQERDAAAAAGRLLDAMLANFAASLSDGDMGGAGTWIAAHRDELNANTEVQTLTRSLAPRDAASATAAADALEKLRESAGPYGYVLNIFEANTRLGLRQGERAISLFLGALASDPTITGAWIDLGTAYYGGFRTDAAWACWDAARSIRPSHPMLKAIDDRERKLRTDHPEFF
jgi:hypothetical protein